VIEVLERQKGMRTQQFTNVFERDGSHSNMARSWATTPSSKTISLPVWVLASCSKLRRGLALIDCLLCCVKGELTRMRTCDAAVATVPAGCSKSPTVLPKRPVVFYEKETNHAPRQKKKTEGKSYQFLN